MESHQVLPDILPFVHQMLRQHIQAGDCVVDGTAGNGYDTLLLAQCVGKHGKVLAFDIQAAALDATQQRLHAHGMAEQVHLIHDSHAHLANYAPSNIAAAVFNFGYLPRGDKNITTLPESSLRAIESALSLLKTNGLLLAVIYHGHEVGKREKDTLMTFFANLPSQNWRVLQYGFVNRPNCPPFVVAVQKVQA